MKKSERAAQARRQLDRKYANAEVTPLAARPRSGWIRAVRTGLGMSQAALAERLSVSSAAVAHLERSEVDATIGLGRLAAVAVALDCRLVYAIVPATSLEDTVQAAARRSAAGRLGYVATTMGLEDQSLNDQQWDDQVTELARRLIDDNEVWRGG